MCIRRVSQGGVRVHYVIATPPCKIPTACVRRSSQGGRCSRACVRATGGVDALVTLLGTESEALQLLASTALGNATW